MQEKQPKLSKNTMKIEPTNNDNIELQEEYIFDYSRGKPGDKSDFRSFDDVNYIKITNDKSELSTSEGGGKVSFVMNGQTGVWDVNDNASGHEFGHLLGLGDRYFYITNQLKDFSGPKEPYTYKDDLNSIMGNPRGTNIGPDQKDIDKILKNVLDQSKGRSEFILDAGEKP